MDHAHSPGAQPRLQRVVPGVFRTLRFRAGPGIAQRRHRSTPESSPCQIGRRCDARSLVHGTSGTGEAC
ncbi:hypothetical protein GZL_04212 [Streptomyces sp. 769]|nr:hypothetical protein GZL_04212 [Streptomyces sp. 769]